MKNKNYPKHFKCKLCGKGLTLKKPWQGRAQGPQCTCNPESWGNWVEIQEPLPDSITLWQG